MKWIVSGADKETGEEMAIEIEADNEESARRRGNRRGLLVADVRPEAIADDLAEDFVEVDQGDFAMEEEVAAEEEADPAFAAVASIPTAAANIAPVAAAHYAAPAMSYQSATRPPVRKAPLYTGLSLASGVLMAVAVMAYGGAVILLVLMIVAIVKSSGSPFGPQLAVSTLLPLSLTLLAGGALYHGMAAGCIALKDIAQNSFR